MEKLSGIYKIENLVNGKFYIGQAVDLNRRKSRHFYLLKKGNHYNSYLQNAFIKYGKENFEFKIILYCEIEKLTYYEQKLVDLYSPEYNMCNECVDSKLGVSHSEETRMKMSVSRRGDKNPNFGKKTSQEIKDKMSKSNSGINSVFFGKKRPDSTRKLMSENHPDCSKEKGHTFKKYEDVLLIKNLLDENISMNKITKITGFCMQTVRRVRDGYYKDAYGI